MIYLRYCKQQNVFHYEYNLREKPERGKIFFFKKNITIIGYLQNTAKEVN